MSNLPSGFPVVKTAVAYLVLDKFHPVGWVYGVTWTIMVIIWLLAIYDICSSEYFDLFADEPKYKSKWAQKLEEIQNRNK
jgi:hypothetical protein